MHRYRSEIIVCLFLVMTTLAVYWQVRDHEFINYDDDLYVTENRHVTNGLTRQGVAWAFTTAHAGYWRPLTFVSHMLDCQIFGLNPTGHHMTSLFFHIVNAMLLFLVLKSLTGVLWRSAFVAALFALHPLHVESVAWMAERKSVLSTFFWILTMWGYVRYAERPNLSRYLLVFLFFLLGLMAKPMLVTLPFVMLLLDFWPLGRLQFGQSGGNIDPQIYDYSPNTRYPRSPFIRLILEKVPFLAIAGGWSFLTFLGEKYSGAAASLELLPLKVRIANALVSYISYTGKMIWPSHLSVFYPHPGMLPVWRVAGAVLLLLFISYIAIRSWQRQPYLAFGWLWYLGTLVPVIGLVQVGLQAMADRHTYIPLIGLFVIIAWGIPDILAKWRFSKIFLPLFAGVAVLVFMVCTWLQVHHWRNSITLFKHAIEVTDNNFFAHNNLGNALAEHGKLNEAIAHYAKALEIRPVFELAHNNMGVALAKQGKLNEAIGHFSRALRIKPDYVKAHNNLGIALTEQGRIVEAVNHFSAVLEIEPDHAEGHYNLGNALVQQESIDKAIAHYKKALRISPFYAEAHNNLGVALAIKGMLNEAIARFSEALRIKPDYREAQKNLVLTRRKMRSPSRAFDAGTR